MSSMRVSPPAMLLAAWLLSACSAGGERSSVLVADRAHSAAGGGEARVRALTDEVPSQAFWLNRVNRLGLASYQQLAAPLLGQAPGGLVWFTDGGERRLGFMRRGDTTSPPELYSVVPEGEGWSSPLAAQLPSFLMHVLVDLTTLSSGRAMSLMVGDDTDYEQVVGRSADGSRASISDAELIHLQHRSRRLYSSFAKSAAAGGGWSKPLAIGGSFGALFGVLEAGPGQRAFAVFVRDLDGVHETVSDRDLYLAAFDGTRWGEAIRLTEDPASELAIETTFLGEELVVAWVRDGDADLETSGDRTVMAATFSFDGSPLRAAAPITATTYQRPWPILGALGGRPVLLFAGDGAEGAGPHPLLQSRLDVEWSPPAPTGLVVGSLVHGSIFTHGDATVLVYEDDSNLVAATSRGGAWHSAGAVQRYGASGARLAEAAYVLDDQARLWIAATASGRGDDEVELPAAVFHLRVPLHADLGVGEILSEPHRLELGQQVTLRVPVRNQGYLYSGAFAITVSDGGDVLASSHQGDGLYPGEERTVELTFAMARPHYRLEVAVQASAPAPELEQDNNRKAVTVAVLPDFAVSVERAGDVVTAVVRDLKSVATTPVNVDFSLIEGDAITELAQRTFDPNAALPISLEVPGLGARSTPYSIAVRVNDRSSVVEQDHGNNLATYVHRPSADFVLDELAISDELVKVVVRNAGASTVDRVALLVTADPELATSPEPLPGVPPIALEEVTLHDGLGTLELPRGALDGHPGYFLYAVANPYGAVAERHRDNNSKQITRVAAATAPPLPPLSPALYATSRVSLGSGVMVRGAIGVREAAGASSPPRPSVDVAADARVEGEIRADSVRLGSRVAVVGSVLHNTLIAMPDATISGAATRPLALPVVAEVPAQPANAPGSGRVVVPRGGMRVLTAGAYGELCVGCGSSAASAGDQAGGEEPLGVMAAAPSSHLILVGGVYDLRVLRLAENARVNCATVCELRVVEPVWIGAGSWLRPTPGGDRGPDELRLFLRGGLTAAAFVELDAEVAALGVVALGDQSRGAGRIFAPEIQLGAGARFLGPTTASSSASSAPSSGAPKKPLGAVIRAETRHPRRK